MSARGNTAESNPSDPAAPKGTGEVRNYKDTLNLPQTSFSMKANLVQNEPVSLKRWASMGPGGLYARVQEATSSAPRFVFHDGPPYANGSIHMGHLMNKCLKDFVVRSRTMAGFHCPFVPGWDCHGLPIEHKVMTELVESGKFDKLRPLEDGQRRMAIRRECQKYAEKYVKLHVSQMSRLLTLADYEHPYLTMTPAYEGATLEVLAALLDAGLVYRALKPVHWSVANETALAEAELEYYDREDISIYVDFEALDADAVYDAFGLPGAPDDDDQEEDADGPRPGFRPHQRPCFMIWTTTPWTLPANVAVAVNPRHEYALVFIDGNITVIARDLVRRVAEAANAERVTVIATAPGERLVGLRYRHPFVVNPPACGLGRVCDERKLWSVVPAEYVTLEDGTGLVHTAPGHGEDDYHTGLREHLPVYSPVQGDGTYDGTTPDWLRGANVWDANRGIVEHLRDSGHLFFDHAFTHSYPHDWRSKTPTIFRCTEQWFVSVDGRHNPPRETDVGRKLREMALRATGEGGEVRFVPEWGRNRLRGMLESRPDWCISRQRSWGLPIPAFFTPEGGCLMTGASVRAVAAAVRQRGADLWFTGTPADLLAHYNAGEDRDLARAGLAPADVEPARLKKGSDILDVWFESGSSWNAVLRERNLGYPADLYLEGSDQHRGWFQLSLLPAIGATGRAPYKVLLTHGFMVDKDGRKLSKSKGDTVDDLFQKFGADVMRWWVSSLSFENDVKVDEEFFKLAGESYRKVRNTLRFMISNLFDYAPADGTDSPQAGAKLPDVPPSSLEAWVLSEFESLSREVAAAYESYDFRTVHNAIYDFCNSTLSAIYLAAVKDRLYCDRADSHRRRRTQAALWHITDGLCRLIAPLLPHTADEAYCTLWATAARDGQHSVHLARFLDPTNIAVDEGWQAAIQSREAGLLALEQAKSSGIDNALDAAVELPDATGKLSALDPVDIADLLGVSRVTFSSSSAGIRVVDLRHSNEPRCERSRKRDGTVRLRSDGGMLSDRDAEALGIS